ncbi:hypothetical protein PF001_g29544 [Phytophthora fragariae]|uniref:Uncharacterized protein n=1 Tax=Phytophthora fragariae TaxID=53985 RepID=A0A6A4B863_9STRA|nr:hypothetical protein PF001_g29544 [Phytophthora fragariae]
MKVAVQRQRCVHKRAESHQDEAAGSAQRKRQEARGSRCSIRRLMQSRGSRCSNKQMFLRRSRRHLQASCGSIPQPVTWLNFGGPGG